MIVIAFQVPINAEVTKCEKAERYQQLVIEKFIQPEQKQDALVLLSRESITPELARQKLIKGTAGRLCFRKLTLVGEKKRIDHVILVLQEGK